MSEEISVALGIWLPHSMAPASGIALNLHVSPDDWTSYLIHLYSLPKSPSVLWIPEISPAGSK